MNYFTWLEKPTLKAFAQSERKKDFTLKRPEKITLKNFIALHIPNNFFN